MKIRESQFVYTLTQPFQYQPIGKGTQEECTTLFLFDSTMNNFHFAAKMKSDFSASMMKNMNLIPDTLVEQAKEFRKEMKLEEITEDKTDDDQGNIDSFLAQLWMNSLDMEKFLKDYESMLTTEGICSINSEDGQWLNKDNFKKIVRHDGMQILGTYFNKFLT